jgi:CheY-like chemotaxis protein
VLLVEDNPVNQRVAQLFLERAGCDVVLAADGEAALAVLAESRVDLVLMDVQMPVMDGLEATRRIRAGGNRIPVVGLTANAMREQMDECRAAGMDDVLAKPIDRERLDAMLERHAPPVGTRTERHVVRPVDRTLAERPEINLARFREVTMDDPVLARGLIASFGESGEHALRDIEAGMAEKDFARVQRGAHTLVGASANMGATRLEAAAVAMERAAGQRDEAAITNLLGATRLRLRAALTELRAL